MLWFSISVTDPGARAYTAACRGATGRRARKVVWQRIEAEDVTKLREYRLHELLVRALDNLLLCGRRRNRAAAPCPSVPGQALGRRVSCRMRARPHKGHKTPKASDRSRLALVEGDRYRRRRRSRYVARRSAIASSWGRMSGSQPMIRGNDHRVPSRVAPSERGTPSIPDVRWSEATAALYGYARDPPRRPCGPLVAAYRLQRR